MSIPFNTLIRPVVAHLAKEYRIAGGAPSEAMIVAIGLQESLFRDRDQVVTGKAPGAVGPATGYWQFEKGGGVRGVMRHAASRDIAKACTDEAGVAWDEDSIWRLFTRPEGDELACVFARLLLLTDPQALPAPVPQSEEEAFAYYLRNWRPGSWFNSEPGSAKRLDLRAKWGRNWKQGIAAVGAGSPLPQPAPTPAAGAPEPTLPHPAQPEGDLEAFVQDVEDALARLRVRILG